MFFVISINIIRLILIWRWDISASSNYMKNEVGLRLLQQGVLEIKKSDFLVVRGKFIKVE